MGPRRPKPSSAQRTGRPALISRDSVVDAGVEIGLPDLTIKAVAQRLGVVPTALYHHVANAHDLSIAVGERIISGLDLPEAAAGPDDYLLQLARALRSLERRHTGIGAFCAAGDPDAVATRATIAKAAERLSTYDVDPTSAVMLTGIIANLAFSFAGRENEEASVDASDDGDALFDWILRNTIRALLDDRDNAPWRA